MFTARNYDSETGLYYYRARYYKPAIGRFLQNDPTGYKDGLNLYTYVRNNPVNYLDPSGMGYHCKAWEESLDEDCAYSDVYKTGMCIACCSEKFVHCVLTHWPTYWYSCFVWYEGCKSACAVSNGTTGPGIPMTFLKGE